MTKCDMKRYCEVLDAEAAGLRRALKDQGGEAIESVSEEYEKMMLAGQRELALALVDRKLRRLRDVEAALRRIEEGTFGACVDCDERISVGRLMAIPWASRCVHCQETADCTTDGIDSSSTSSLHDQPSQLKLHTRETMKHKQSMDTGVLAASGRLSNNEFAARGAALSKRGKTDETLWNLGLSRKDLWRC